jgi:hypothetical protein
MFVTTSFTFSYARRPPNEIKAEMEKGKGTRMTKPTKKKYGGGWLTGQNVLVGVWRLRFHPPFF